jgi:hypothetical protein
MVAADVVFFQVASGCMCARLMASTTPMCCRPAWQDRVRLIAEAFWAEVGEGFAAIRLGLISEIRRRYRIYLLTVTYLDDALVNIWWQVRRLRRQRFGATAGTIFE